MAGFVRRFTFVPTIAVIKEIEGVVIIDLAPPEPATGAGTGAVLVVGEFEDGFFATEPEAKGAVEVFGSQDYAQKFGSFGFTYAGVVANNPCARRHIGEAWNGNGFLKTFKLKASRLMCARVDTSVGSVSFDPLAFIDGGVGPFVFAAAQTIAFTTNTGAASSTALTGTVATSAGASGVFTTVTSGETFGIKIDGGPQINVTFGAADITAAAQIARINATLGFTCAILNTTEIDLRGLQVGSGGTVELIEVTTGLLTKLGHTAGVTSGTGTFPNLNAVTAAQLVAFINGVAGLGAVNLKASTGPDGQVRFYNSTSVAAATIAIASGAMAIAAGVTSLGVTTALTDHEGGTIAAGTRVRTVGGLEWVTMQTLDVPAGVLGPYVVKVRPATDNGTAVGTTAGTVVTIVDPAFGMLKVTNPAALAAALSENAIDAKYQAALDATLDQSGAAREANYLLIARRTDAVVMAGRSNAYAATEQGLLARKFVTGDPLGTTVNDALVNVAKFRGDRVFYTSKGLKVTIPQIQERGTDGGDGFSADGVITVRPDGPLTSICATLPPEENPGQSTGLIEDFFEVDTSGETLSIDSYKAYKRNGIAVPRRDRQSGMVFQSGDTSSLESGRRTMARRKMADFIQDTAADLFNPFVKKLNSQARRDKVRGIWEQFLGGLQSAKNPAAARIEGFTVDDSVNAGNTADVLALGVYYLLTAVRTLPSMEDIVVQTNIGENAVISSS
jgi:hypothetical protein